MGNFIWNGKNKIFDDIKNLLPTAVIYYKESNIIPYTTELTQTGHGLLTYIEHFDISLYPVGTDVDIYINDKKYITTKILPTSSIYLILNPPYGNFKLKTIINNITYREEQYISTNLYTFFMILSQMFTIDYRRLLNIFGNLYDKYLQNNMLFNKIGWYYDFALPSGWTHEEYRKILTGYDINNILSYEPMNKLFLNSLTLYSVNELCRSFTGTFPIIESQRDEDGWVIIDDTLLSSSDIFWVATSGLDKYYLCDGVTGNLNIDGIDYNTLTLNLEIKGVAINVTFTPTATATDVINQINAVISATSLGSTVVAEIKTYPPYDYIPSTTTLKQYLHFNNTLETGEGLFEEGDFIVISGTAIVPLGLEVGEWGIEEEGIDSDKIITLFDDQYHYNKIKITIKQSSHLITENIIKGPNLVVAGNEMDKIKHKYVIETSTIDPTHDFPVTITVGATTYNITTDYILYTPDNINYYIKWVTLTPPASNSSYTINYYYIMQEEIGNLLNKIIPPYLLVEYVYEE
jgi:hypothetical protein